MKPSQMELRIPYRVINSRVVKTTDSPEIKKDDVIFYDNEDTAVLIHYEKENSVPTGNFRIDTIKRFQLEDKDNNLSKFEIRPVNSTEVTIEFTDRGWLSFHDVYKNEYCINRYRYNV